MVSLRSPPGAEEKQAEKTTSAFRLPASAEASRRPPGLHLCCLVKASNRIVTSPCQKLILLMISPCTPLFHFPTPSKRQTLSGVA